MACPAGNGENHQAAGNDQAAKEGREALEGEPTGMIVVGVFFRPFRFSSTRGILPYRLQKPLRIERIADTGFLRTICLMDPIVPGHLSP